MRIRRFALTLIVFAAVLSAVSAAQVKPPSADDAVLKKMIDLGLKDNQVMTWLDIVSNRFGGRFTGTDAYANAAAWALWQFKQWGVQAELDEVGEVPVGFNRGPWFGKMIKPVEKALYFGTPTMTAGTKGVQRGPVVVAPAKEEEVEAIKDKIKGAWVLIPGESNGIGPRRAPGSPDVAADPQKLCEAGCLGTIQMSKEPIKMLDGQILKWEDLPVLPDIKLTESQYNEIKGLVEKGEPRSSWSSTSATGSRWARSNTTTSWPGSRARPIPTSAWSWAATSTVSIRPPAASTTARASPRHGGPAASWPRPGPSPSAPS